MMVIGQIAVIGMIIMVLTLSLSIMNMTFMIKMKEIEKHLPMS